MPMMSPPKTYKVVDGPTDEAVKLKATGLMSFQMHNLDFEIPIDTLEDILHIPNDGNTRGPQLF